MALSFFRHWFAQRLITNHGHSSPDGGFALYALLGAGGDAYMDKAILSQFHTMFPMTKKALNVLENHLLEIKECMSEWVDKSDLLKSNCQLNVQMYPVGYATCVEFENGDFPWGGRGEEERVGKRGKRPGGNEVTMRNLERAKRHQEAREGEASVGPDEDEDEDTVEEELVDVEREGGQKRARYV